MAPPVGQPASELDVHVNIYDLNAHNAWLAPLGLGVFHSGVEVDGREYAFGGHAVEGRSGVYALAPRRGPPFPYIRFRESVLVGRTALSPAAVRAAVRALAGDWLGPSYHLLGRNCNHFSAALCGELVPTAHPPQLRWINRMASVGSAVPWLIPRSWLALPQPFDTGVGSGGVGSGGVGSGGVGGEPRRRGSSSSWFSRRRPSSVSASGIQAAPQSPESPRADSPRADSPRADGPASPGPNSPRPTGKRPTSPLQTAAAALVALWRTGTSPRSPADSRYIVAGGPSAASPGGPPRSSGPFSSVVADGSPSGARRPAAAALVNPTADGAWPEEIAGADP